jgi:nicotinamide riboside kinase
MKNILISGSYSVGKSTLIDTLEKKIPEKDRVVTYDLARWWLDKNRKNAQDITNEERREMQLNVCAGYIGAIKQSTHSKIMALMDGSLIEAYAYSEGVLGEETMDRITEYLLDYHEHSIAYVIPPTIPLEHDGLRHTDKEYRVYIHERIMQVLEAFGIPHHVILSQTPEERAEEIYNLHFHE